MEANKTLILGQFPVQSTNKRDLARRLLDGIYAKQQHLLFFANTNFIVKCRPLLAQVADPSVVIVNDGVGMDIAAKWVLGARFEENLNGTDFTPFLFGQAKRPLKVFMLGAAPAVLAGAVAHVRQKLGQEVVGSCDGFEGMADTEALVARINGSGAEVLLVAMGNPLQEAWILRHRASLQVSLLMGVGALFDFWSGGKARAPLLVQRFRIEWFYRLCLEPRRLLRRYTFDVAVFLRHCFKYR